MEEEPIVEIDNSEVVSELEKINEYIDQQNKELELEAKQLEEEEKVEQAELKKEAAIQEQTEKEEQEYKENQEETLNSISENLEELQKVNEEQNVILSAEPDGTQVYQVVLADEQLDKLKGQKDSYTEVGGDVLSAVIGLYIGFQGIKGLLNIWKS